MCASVCHIVCRWKDNLWWSVPTVRFLTIDLRAFAHWNHLAVPDFQLQYHHPINNNRMYLLMLYGRNKGGKEGREDVRKEEWKLKRKGEMKGRRREGGWEVGKAWGERTAESVGRLSGLWSRRQGSYSGAQYLSGLRCRSPVITPPGRVASPLGHHLAQDPFNVDSLYPPIYLFAFLGYCNFYFFLPLSLSLFEDEVFFSAHVW